MLRSSQGTIGDTAARGTEINLNSVFKLYIHRSCLCFMEDEGEGERYQEQGLLSHLPL